MVDTVKSEKEHDNLTMSGVKGAVQFWLPFIFIIISLVSGWVLMGAQIRQIQIDATRMRYEFELHMADVTNAKNERNDQYTAIQVELAKLNATLVYIQKEIEAIELAK
jgi:hypothetical protein